MRRTTNKRPIRLTESGLRRIIRSVIRESLEDQPTVKNQVQIQWSYDDRDDKKAVSTILSAIAQQKDLRLLGVPPEDIKSPTNMPRRGLIGRPYDTFPDEPISEISITYDISFETKGVDSGKHPLAYMTFTLTPIDESKMVEASHPIEIEMEVSGSFVDIKRIECID